MEKVDKLEIAKQMLDASIDEYLDHHRYFAALNLAGVAEEILVKFIRINGGKDSQSRLVDSVKIVNQTLKGRKISDKEWKKVQSGLKNSVKHMNSGNDRYIETNIIDEARRKINAAVYNNKACGLSATPNIERFCKHRKDMAHHKNLLS